LRICRRTLAKHGQRLALDALRPKEARLSGECCLQMIAGHCDCALVRCEIW